MRLAEDFTGDHAQDYAANRLLELLKTREDIKKIDMRSNKGGFKLIFRTQEPKDEEKE